MSVLTSANSERESRGPLTLAVIWVLTGLATVAVMARFFVRQYMVQSIGIDDILIGITMALILTVCATATVSVTYGLGRHTSVLAIEDAEKALLFHVISLLLGLVTFTIPKIAVAALLNRLLNPGCLHRCVIFGLCAIVTILAVVNIVLWVIMCSPRDSIWRISLVLNGQATCTNVGPLVDYTTFNGAACGVVDLYFAAYPGFVLYRLQMSLRKKIGLSIALGLGVCAAAVAIARCTSIKGLTHQLDLTYSTVPLVILTHAEGVALVLASCIPTLLPLATFTGGERYGWSSCQQRRRQRLYQIQDNTWTNNPGQQETGSKGRRKGSVSIEVESQRTHSEERLCTYTCRGDDAVRSVGYEMEIVSPPPARTAGELSVS